MSNRINELVDKIAKLEYQLVNEIEEQQEEFKYKLVGAGVKFDGASFEAHRVLKVAILPWIFLQNLGISYRSPLFTA